MDPEFPGEEKPAQRGSFGITMRTEDDEHYVDVPEWLFWLLVNNGYSADVVVPFLREYQREMTERLGWTEDDYTKALAELDNLPEEFTSAKLGMIRPAGADGDRLEPEPIPAAIASVENVLTPGSFGLEIEFTLRVPEKLAELLANNRIDRAAGVASFLTKYRKEVQEYLGWTDEQYSLALAELKRLPPWLRQPTPPGMDAVLCGVRP